MTLASKNMIGKSKDDRFGRKVQNNPGKWNKDMVANIMGPPADRK
jgi:hypothetical protein